MKQRLYRLAGLMPVVALAAALHGSPVVAQTTDQAQAWPPAASVPALQARMKSIRAETDPERRMALMEEQIKALDAASQGTPAGCPMVGGQMPGGPMGAGPMMRGGAAGPGAGPGAGPMGGLMMDPKLMQEHMKLMQQHMGVMQNMMKMYPAGKPAMPN
jgi:hypothetical protein